MSATLQQQREARERAVRELAKAISDVAKSPELRRMQDETVKGMVAVIVGFAPAVATFKRGMDDLKKVNAAAALRRGTVQ